MASLPKEYASLKAGRSIESSSKISSLNPFLDSGGMIRVGERLQNSSLSFNARHPIILPRYHPLTRSIIEHYHRKLLHAGPQALLATIRLQYWPIGGRKAVAHVLNKCIQCFRAKPKLLQNIMGELPAERVQMQRPFYTTGVDFCGPFCYKPDVRNRPPVKCYICIFFCFSTKACHLELVKDLTTTSFLAALKRFVSLRGKPRVIWSDNATNFFGAKNELKEIRTLLLNEHHVNAVQNQCLDDGIDWRFIPPRSRHFGGLWEAAVKMAKFYFRRAVGLTVLSFEELRNPDDLQVLTPAHFLTGGALTAMAEPDLANIELNRLSHCQRMTRIQQQFWKTWSTAYLTLLQERSKWRKRSPNVAVNSLVLLKDDNLPTMKWQMGRIVDVVKGKDGIARVAIIRTINGTTQRAITKLCLLPVE
ncbi:uncharacterized protein LOC118734967 [Rhagoletis pomonella]|uniref:uncharacterized protein LOC118734967 n=1 Tax=Rhagoletis pomonella TaxID=28610 RepID=UPI001785A839|nr:uncharacterized protein LOC118734967 [Rhagoletis pomonella]